MTASGCEELISAKRAEELRGVYGLHSGMDFVNYLVAKGTCTMSQGTAAYQKYYIQIPAEQAQAAAVAAANNIELAAQAALVEEQKQLALQAQMLQSNNATWQSQDAYNIALADTNKGIAVYNATVTGLPSETVTTDIPVSTGLTIDNKMKSIIMVVIVAILVLIIFRK